MKEIVIRKVIRIRKLIVSITFNLKLGFNYVLRLVVWLNKCSWNMYITYLSTSLEYLNHVYVIVSERQLLYLSLATFVYWHTIPSVFSKQWKQHTIFELVLNIYLPLNSSYLLTERKTTTEYNRFSSVNAQR